MVVSTNEAEMPEIAVIMERTGPEDLQRWDWVVDFLGVTCSPMPNQGLREPRGRTLPGALGASRVREASAAMGSVVVLWRPLWWEVGEGAGFVFQFYSSPA